MASLKESPTKRLSYIVPNEFLHDSFARNPAEGLIFISDGLLDYMALRNRRGKEIQHKYINFLRSRERARLRQTFSQYLTERDRQADLLSENDLEFSSPEDSQLELSEIDGVDLSLGEELYGDEMLDSDVEENEEEENISGIKAFSMRVRSRTEKDIADIRTKLWSAIVRKDIPKVRPTQV